MSETKVPHTLVGPLLQSFFMEHLCHHKRTEPADGEELSGYIPAAAPIPSD